MQAKTSITSVFISIFVSLLSMLTPLQIKKQMATNCITSQKRAPLTIYESNESVRCEFILRLFSKNRMETKKVQMSDSFRTPSTMMALLLQRRPPTISQTMKRPQIMTAEEYLLISAC